MSNNAAMTFYLKVRETFPSAQQLQEPTPDMTIKELWLAMGTQLQVSEADMASRLAERFDIPLAQEIYNADTTLVAKMPYANASADYAVPLRREGGTTLVAVSNPFDESLMQSIRFIFGNNFRLVMAPPDEIEIAIARAYSSIEDDRQASKPGYQRGAKVLKLGDRVINEGEIPKLARQLLARAVALNASDIHIQPFIGGAAIRLRIDGMLRRLVIIPDAVNDAVLRYFKAQGKMDPTNHLVQQDGRMALQLDDREFDLRLSTLPVAGGEEKLVIRILNRNAVYKLQGSGMSLAEIHTLRRMAVSPSGVVLLCGPTGSGKTTTLYSILSEVNTESVSIATVENPVEYQMPGLAQTEVNAKAGLTFASALRAILRQDPDVILIGEIRDEETAQIALQSALTGHLVFSTLHTNDAVTAIPRLLDLGVSPQILAQALTGVVSQRLLRRLCEHCKQPVTECVEPQETLFEQITRVRPGARATGCEKCNYSGFSGRVVVTEMIEINAKLVELIASGAAAPADLLAACNSDFTSIAQAAARRIISGDTNPAEAYRVIGRPFWLDIAKAYQADIPDLGVLSASAGSDGKGQPGVLLVGAQETWPADMRGALEQSWFQLFAADSPERARAELQNHDSISFVVVDIPDALSDEQATRYVDDYRVAMAWSRLPALLVLPDGRPDLQQKLIDEGATSRFAARSTPADAVVEMINEALTRKEDFRWGMDGVDA